LLALLDVGVDDPQWRDLDPPQRRQRTLDAVKRLLLRESQAQPLLLVIEDLHSIDSETQALLDSLVESLPYARVLLLVNYRPEYQHGWGSKTYYRQLRIDPLPTESAEDLLLAVLGDDANLRPLKQLLIERTEGNPFFLEESVRTLVETKVLVGGRGKYRLTGPIGITRVPATVHAVLAARVDRLSLDEKGLLQSAAVIGKDVPFVLLHAIAELSEEELRRELGHLQAAEFLYETRLFPDLEYTFKHSLTHEVAYGSLLQERRRALHARIVDVIETLYSDHLAEQVDTLAHHAYRAEVWEKAVTYLHQAGGKAAAGSANREALACFEHALVALKNLPENREILERAIDLRLDIRNALMPLAENERISGYLREAEALAHTLNDQRRLGWVSAYIAENIRADHDRAIESAQRALVIAQDLKDFSLQVVANYFLGILNDGQGDYRRAIEFLRWNVSSIEGERIFERVGQSGLPFLPSRARLVLCLAELGEFQEGTTNGEETVRVAEAVDHHV
jgi:predicted ATPase